MNIFKIVGKAVGALFGSDSKDKGIVQEVSDVVDKWHPSEVTRHEMAIENETAGDASQADARAMALPRTDSSISFVSIFNAFVDGVNRLVRPVFTFWVFGLLTDLVPVPSNWSTWPPMLWNIVWTIVTFWFGSRLLFKDIPSMYKWYKNLNQ